MYFLRARHCSILYQNTLLFIFLFNIFYSLISGPVSSYLINLLGARPVCIIGTLIGSAGVIISVFVNNIQALYVTFGIIAGYIGFTFAIFENSYLYVIILFVLAIQHRGIVAGDEGPRSPAF